MSDNLKLYEPRLNMKAFFKEPLVIVFLAYKFVGLGLFGCLFFGLSDMNPGIRWIMAVYILISASQTALVLGFIGYLAYLASYFVAEDSAEGAYVFAPVSLMEGRIRALRQREKDLYTTAKQVFAWREKLKKHIRECGAQLTDSYTGWEPCIVPNNWAMPVFPKRDENLN